MNPTKMVTRPKQTYSKDLLSDSVKENIPAFHTMRKGQAMPPPLPSFSNLNDIACLGTLANSSSSSISGSASASSLGSLNGINSEKIVLAQGHPSHAAMLRSKTDSPCTASAAAMLASADSSPLAEKHLRSFGLNNSQSFNIGALNSQINGTKRTAGPTQHVPNHFVTRFNPYGRSTSGNVVVFGSTINSSLATSMSNGTNSARGSPVIRQHMELLRIGPNYQRSRTSLPILSSNDASSMSSSNQMQISHPGINNGAPSQGQRHRADQYMLSSDLLSDPISSCSLAPHMGGRREPTQGTGVVAGLASPPQTSSPDASAKLRKQSSLADMSQLIDENQCMDEVEDEQCENEEDEEEWMPTEQGNVRLQRLEEMVRIKRDSLEKEELAREEKRRLIMQTATYGPLGTASPKLLESEPTDVWAADIYHLEHCVWEWSLHREQAYASDPTYFARHSGVEPHVRATVIDWMIEVCEEYFLHRETLHLATAYFDRFMSKARGIKRSQVQLVGVTALFIAAKLEEIYPPRIDEFAKVCDGACTIDDILGLEIHMLETLNWELNPPTVNLWMNIYFNNAVRIAGKRYSEFPAMTSTAPLPPPLRPGLRPRTNHSGASIASDPTTASIPRWARMRNFPGPRFRRREFKACMCLADAALVDEESLRFRPSAIAAAALYVMHSTRENVSEFVEDITGYTEEQLDHIVKWIEAFKSWPQVGRRERFPNIHESDTHNIQTHNKALLEMYREHASQRIKEARASS